MSGARGVTKHGSMREWLNSKPPGGGGGGKFLSGWKKKPGYVDTFLHTQCLPMTVWQHTFPTFVPVKKDGEETVHVWGRKYTCHETDDVLGTMYFREEKGNPSSAREHPPQRCGFCKLIEYVWLQCWAWLDTHEWDDEAKAWNETKKGKGKGIDPCAVLFRFTSEAKDEENTTIHAGGLCGLFGRKEPPDDLVKAMKANRISPRDAWKESIVAKAQSVMCVVDNDDPSAGIQISTETKELGEKVKDEIRRVFKSTNGKVDIQRQPYCIRWEYDGEAQMGKMYTATRMEEIKPSPRVLALIRGPVPDLKSVETPFNQRSMRATLERHCKVKTIPWGEIFPTPEQEKQWAEEDSAAAADSDAEHDAPDDDRGVDDRDADVAGEDPADDHGVSDADEEVVACDECGKAIKVTDPKCPHCGHVYEEEEAEPPPPPPKPPTRTRAEVAAAAKKKAAASTKQKAEPPPPPDSTTSVGDPEDELPF